MSQDDIAIATLVVAVLTFIAAVVAAVYAFFTYRLKSGIEIRGSYSLMSSIAAEDQYIGEVTLENLKDRAVVIFKIFLEVSHGYYIEIDDFDDKPLILGPFEAFRRQYEPIDLYSVGMHRIRIDNLLGDKKTRRRLVLSTSQGRYNVAHHIDRWDPVADFFRNYATAIVRPLRSTFKGRSYGSGTKYIVELVTDGGKKEVIPIYPRDHQVKKFRSFNLTPESLKSREALETYLLERAAAGELRCSDFTVLDLEQWRREVYHDHNKKIFQAVPRGWFAYNVLGWFVTRWEDLRLSRSNRANQRRHREALQAKARASEGNKRHSV